MCFIVERWINWQYQFRCFDFRTKSRSCRQRHSTTLLEPTGPENSLTSKSYRSMLTHENLEALAQLERHNPKVDPSGELSL